MAPDVSSEERKLAHAMARIAEAWELKLSKTPTPTVGPNDRLLVVGPSAVLAVARAFEAGTALSISEQVTVWRRHRRTANSDSF